MAVESPNRITFNEHPFAIQLAKYWEIALKREGFKQSNPEYDHLMKVNDQCSKIEHTLHTLQISRVLLAERHSLVEVYSRIGTRDFLRYVLENYFLRITTYKDQILQLIDVVLELGIQKGPHFEKKLKAKVSGLKGIIDAIERTNTLFINVKSIRNKIAHEGQLDNPHLHTLELNEVAFEELPQYRPYIEEDSRNILNQLILENTKDMIKIEEDLMTDFFSILNALLEHFIKAVDSKEK